MSGTGEVVMGEAGLRRMSAQEFVRRIGVVSGQHNTGAAPRQHDTRYAFWLGAGCSISSGIPGASTLVTERWLPQLQRVRGATDQDVHEWASSAFPEYDPADPGAKYGEVMEELFIQAEARQREVEALCDGRYPGFGYAVLAALLGRPDGLFNVALTTNFDDLIADAMYVFTEARPLVIPDESLAPFIRPTRMRPLVVKVHGDHRLSPRNTRTETDKLKEGISESIRNLLHDRGVIFVGYGGNDRGICEVLEALPRQALPLGVWWVNPEPPAGAILPWLEDREAIWVEARGFDELMLLLRDEFGLPHPSSTKFDRLFADYLQKFKELSGRVERITEIDAETLLLKDAAARAEAATSDWPAVFLQASEAEKTDPAKAEGIYRRGIEEFPQSAVLPSGYCELLVFQGRYADALPVIEKAAELDPDNALIEAARAQILGYLGRSAESHKAFEKAIELSPGAGGLHAAFGLFLVLAGNREAAERELERALELQPTGIDEMSQVAPLFDQLGNPQAALAMHRRIVEELPDDANARSNLARCLIGLRQIEEAHAEVNRALVQMAPHQYPTLLEAHYYRFVIGEEAEREESLQRIRKMILDGHRSPLWDLEPVSAYGVIAGHPDSSWLVPLAGAIGGEQPPGALDDWERWSALEGAAE